MKTLFTIFFIILGTSALGKKDVRLMNTPDHWKKVKLERQRPTESLACRDTSFIVVSNRKMLDNDIRFMREEMQEEGVHYFFVYIKDGTTYAFQTGSLYEAMQYMPDISKDWVVYTDGMGKLFTGSLNSAKKLSSVYDLNVILFDYPSISSRKNAPGNYFFAKRNSGLAYKNFGPVLDTIRHLRTMNQMGSGKLSLMFHSIGNNLLKEMVVNNSIASLNSRAWVDNLILNAACVPEKGHSAWLGKIGFAREVYVHYNSSDVVLKLAHVISMRRQLGERVRDPLTDKAIYINFNTVNRKHNSFLPGDDDPVDAVSMKHYGELLHGALILPVNHPRFQKSEPHHAGWVLNPATAAL